MRHHSQIHCYTQFPKCHRLVETPICYYSQYAVTRRSLLNNKIIIIHVYTWSEFNTIMTININTAFRTSLLPSLLHLMLPAKTIERHVKLARNRKIFIFRLLFLTYGVCGEQGIDFDPRISTGYDHDQGHAQ